MEGVFIHFERSLKLICPLFGNSNAVQQRRKREREKESEERERERESFGWRVVVLKQGGVRQKRACAKSHSFSPASASSCRRWGIERIRDLIRSFGSSRFPRFPLSPHAGKIKIPSSFLHFTKPQFYPCESRISEKCQKKIGGLVQNWGHFISFSSRLHKWGSFRAPEVFFMVKWLGSCRFDVGLCCVKGSSFERWSQVGMLEIGLWFGGV